jgi:hypothetical protein
MVADAQAPLSALSISTSPGVDELYYLSKDRLSSHGAAVVELSSTPLVSTGSSAKSWRCRSGARRSVVPLHTGMTAFPHCDLWAKRSREAPDAGDVATTPVIWPKLPSRRPFTLFEQASP